jgi:tetratricopeptide (TPR) repeat protein
MFKRRRWAGEPWIGILFGAILSWGTALAQEPVEVQLFLPGGLLPEQEIRLLLLDGADQEKKLLTEARGRFRFPATSFSGNPHFRIPGDKRSFETEELWMAKVQGMKLVPIFLQPGKEAVLPPKESIDLAGSDARAPVEARAGLERARRFLADKKVADAVSEFTKALTLYPRYLRALDELGEMFLRLGLTADAVDVYEHVWRFNRSDPAICMNLSAAYRGIGQNEKAQAVLEQLLKERPELGKLRFQLAEILMNARQYDSAVEQLRLGLNDSALDKASRADGLTRLGFLYLREERNQAALRELQKAVEFDPTNASARLYLGTALVNLDRKDEAEAALRKAYELGGARMALALLALGELYYNTRKFDLALPAFEQYLKDAPAAANAALVRGYIDRLKAIKK